MFEGNGLDTIKDYTYSALSSLISAYWAIEGEQSKFEVSDEPVWILGEKYDTREDIEGAQHDVLSRLWLTYRRLFPSLGEPANLTSDRGWGCMLRCGQMLLAEALIRQQLGRAWRWTPDCCVEKYLRIVRLFEDQPAAPFSLHVMTTVGVTTGKNVGEWYGPNTVAHLIKRLPESEAWSNFAVSVAINNVLIVDQTRAVGRCAGSWRPLLLLLPLRLGVDTLNEIYIETLQRFFHVPQGLGILGGTPSHALFLIGYVGKDVIYLDPHTTQDSASVGKKETDTEKEADFSYHCHSTPRMPFIRLDPSIAMCFLCKTEEEYDDLITRLRCNLHDVSSEGIGTTPSTSSGSSSGIIEVMDTLPDYMRDSDDEETELVAMDTSSEDAENGVASVGSENSDLPCYATVGDCLRVPGDTPGNKRPVSSSCEDMYCDCVDITNDKTLELPRDVELIPESSGFETAEPPHHVRTHGGPQCFTDAIENSEDLINESMNESFSSSSSGLSDCYKDFEIL